MEPMVLSPEFFDRLPVEVLPLKRFSSPRAVLKIAMMPEFQECDVRLVAPIYK